MRKISLTAIAALALAGGGAAFAQTQQTNTYKVTDSVSPKKSGSKSKSTGVSVKFGYGIGETHGLKPAAVTRYTVGLAGVRSIGHNLKTCKPGKMQASGGSCPSAARV